MSETTPKLDEGRLFALLAYLLSIVGVVIVLVAKKDSRFAVFHAKQSLILFFGWVLSGGLLMAHVPFLSSLISWLLNLALFVLWVVGIVYALTGQEKSLPVVGDLAAKMKF